MELIVVIVLLVVFCLFMDAWAHSDVIDQIAELIRCEFFGKSPEEVHLALAPTFRAEQLCPPLTEEEMQRIRGCTEVERADLTVKETHWLKMYLGVADLVVRYAFAGTDAGGERVLVEKTVFLRVKYTSTRSRLGLRSVTLDDVSSWNPSEKEREKLLRSVSQ